MTFRDLHKQDKPLLLANVWDVPSTKIAEKLNYQAIGTSSAAIAALFGYRDGEDMTFSEMEYAVKRIASHITKPLSVDIESGYSREPGKIAEHIRVLAEAGASGINIEDSIVNGKRTLSDSAIFAERLKKITLALQRENIDIFINVRTDTFILLQENVIEETMSRISMYKNAGADGIFTPGVVNKEDIKMIAESTDLPLNVMCMPGLPDFQTLSCLGVKRISMGNFLFNKMYDSYTEMLDNVTSANSFDHIF